MTYWISELPKKCDICGEEEVAEKFYDARTQMGPWGCLCEVCFISFGTGLGMGRGQRFELTATGRFEKTGG